MLRSKVKSEPVGEIVAESAEWRVELLGKRNTRSWDVRVVDKRESRSPDEPMRRAYPMFYNRRAKSFHGVGSSILDDYFPTVKAWAFHAVSCAVEGRM